MNRCCKKNRGLPLCKGRTIHLSSALLIPVRGSIATLTSYPDRIPVESPCPSRKGDCRRGLANSRCGAAVAGSHLMTPCPPGTMSRNFSGCGTPPIIKEVISGVILHAHETLPPAVRSTVVRVDRSAGGCTECRLQILPIWMGW
ncbi:MAG: hypothetical protein GKC06_05975 [Methanomicrobiales archaeon]|nr:hypothetical protein [Methanomicrobiales archaeon]